MEAKPPVSVQGALTDVFVHDVNIAGREGEVESARSETIKSILIKLDMVC